jgi:hypothetical protein
VDRQAAKNFGPASTGVSRPIRRATPTRSHPLPDGTSKKDEGGKEIKVDIEDVDSASTAGKKTPRSTSGCILRQRRGVGPPHQNTQETKASMTPKKHMDKPRGECGTRSRLLYGDRLWVKLNGETVIENARLRASRPGSIALQHHGT